MDGRRLQIQTTRTLAAACAPARLPTPAGPPRAAHRTPASSWPVAVWIVGAKKGAGTRASVRCQDTRGESEWAIHPFFPQKTHARTRARTHLLNHLGGDVHAHHARRVVGEPRPAQPCAWVDKRKKKEKGQSHCDSSRARMPTDDPRTGAAAEVEDAEGLVERLQHVHGGLRRRRRALRCWG